MEHPCVYQHVVGKDLEVKLQENRSTNHKVKSAKHCSCDLSKWLPRNENYSLIYDA